MRLGFFAVFAFICSQVACGGADIEDLDVMEPPEVAESTEYLEGAETVSTNNIRKLGVVRFNGCSGTLVTPYWVLTAAHCGASAGDTVRLGNDSDSTAPTALIAATPTNHPSFPSTGTCRPFDAKLIRLATPLWLAKDDGTVWEQQRRDLFRGSVPNLEGGNADVYGYGDSDDQGNGFGVLRFSAFEVFDIETSHVELNELDDERTRSGDSGGPYFTPSSGAPGANPNYKIAAVHNCTDHALDDTYKGTRADTIAAWFDSTIGAPRRPTG